MSATPALEVRGLTKRYGGRSGPQVLAVDGISLQVARGEVVGLLGPNGAGKTTALHLSLALLRPDAGEVRLFGGAPDLLAARRRIGYAPDAPLFPRRLTGLEVLELHGRLLGHPRLEARRRASAIAEELGLAESATRRCGTFSRGQAQRLGLAQALLGSPELVLLDEPTAGLDPAAVAALRRLILELRERGVAVLLNSHLLSEVERVCDRVLFLKGGRIVGEHRVRAQGLFAELRLGNAAPEREQLARQHPGSSLREDRLRVPLAQASAMPALLSQVLDQGGQVLEARPIGEELEHLYLSLVEGRP